MMRSSLVLRLMIFLSALVLAANSNAESLDASKSLDDVLVLRGIRMGAVGPW